MHRARYLPRLLTEGAWRQHQICIVLLRFADVRYCATGQRISPRYLIISRGRCLEHWHQVTHRHAVPVKLKPRQSLKHSAEKRRSARQPS
jgi:hypothetical protein